MVVRMNEARPALPTTATVADENLYLIGRPTLKQFVRFVRDHAVDPPAVGDLVEEWQVARELVRTLEKEEAGAADDPPIASLGPDDDRLLIVDGLKLVCSYHIVIRELNNGFA